MRFVRMAAAVLVVTWTNTAPAQAHSAAGSPSSNYTTTIRSVLPEPKGFTVRSIEQGSRLEVRWTSGEPAVVSGYEDEPYLRIGPDGVEENRSSPATYVNRDRRGTTAAPQTIDAQATPRWVAVSDRPVARFHDHRAHYMGSVPPQAVDRQPNLRRTIQRFDVPISQGKQKYVVSGVVEWVPSSSPVQYLAVSTAIIAVLVVAALWAGVSLTRRMTVRPLIIGALGALILVDFVHLAGIAGGVAGGSPVGRAISIGYASIAAWVIAVVSAVLWLKGRPDALYLTTFAAGLMTLVGGIADLSILGKPAVVFQWAPSLARWCVALTLGLGIGILVAAVLLTRPSDSDAIIGNERVGD